MPLKTSDSARAVLFQLLQESNLPEGAVARLAEDGEGFSLQIGDVEETDETFDHEGHAVLAIDQQVASQLDGCTLDIEITETGPALILKEENPST